MASVVVRPTTRIHSRAFGESVTLNERLTEFYELKRSRDQASNAALRIRDMSTRASSSWGKPIVESSALRVSV